MIQSLLTAEGIKKNPLGVRETQFWVENTIAELQDEGFCATASRFNEVALDYEKNGRRAPPMAQLIGECLTRYAPEDMVFSMPMMTFITALCDRPALVTMYAWSLVIETLRAERTIYLRDFRFTFGPNGVPDETSYKALWEAQKIARDPISRSDNWLERGDAWTLEGLARKNADA